MEWVSLSQYFTNFSNGVPFWNDVLFLNGTKLFTNRRGLQMEAKNSEAWHAQLFCG
jgi:hypothetical protein